MAKKFAELRDRMMAGSAARWDATRFRGPRSRQQRGSTAGPHVACRTKCPMTGTSVGRSPTCFAIYHVAANACPVGRRSPGQAALVAGAVENHHV